MERITENDIKEILSEHYGTGINRDLVKNVRGDGHSPTNGSVIYSLRGSPPKGYAIVIPELRKVNFYDNHGKRFRRMHEAEVIEISSERLASIDDFETGSVYAIPALGRTGSKSWVVSEVSGSGIHFLKRGGSTGGTLNWEDRHSNADRTLRELVEDGEVYKTGERSSVGDC